MDERFRGAVRAGQIGVSRISGGPGVSCRVGGAWRRRVSSMAYVLVCAVRRIGLAHTQFADATCGTIRLKLFKIGALVKVSARRIKFALPSACPYADEWRLAAACLTRAAPVSV